MTAEKLATIVTILSPILLTIGLGILAKRRQILSQEGVQGLQDFVAKFCLPFLLFKSSYQSDYGADTMASMALITPTFLVLSAAGFYLLGKKRAPFHNFPMACATKEGGMLGTPLFLVLFGAEEVYRIASLDVAHMLVAVPTICIVSSLGTGNLSIREIAKKTLSSPIFLAAVGGLVLNLTGVRAALEPTLAGSLISEMTAFLSAPVSAVILFCIGYSLSLKALRSSSALKLFAGLWTVYLIACGILQLLLFLIPGTVALTRWAVLFFCVLPPTFLLPGFGATEEEKSICAGLCSMGTVFALVVFFIMAVFAVG